jgi:hypothetical protein
MTTPLPSWIRKVCFNRKKEARCGQPGTESKIAGLDLYQFLCRHIAGGPGLVLQLHQRSDRSQHYNRIKFK